MALLTDRDEIISLIDCEVNKFVLTPALSNLNIEALYQLITSTEYMKLRQRHKWNLLLKCWALSLDYKVYNPDWLEGPNRKIHNIERWEMVVKQYMNDYKPTNGTNLDKLVSQYSRV
jgi:hypothetical protein